MAYCRNCGAEIDEKAVICPSCGVAQQEKKDSGSIGYGILGFFVPIVGLILYLIWKVSKPKSAKAAGIGALVWVIYTVVALTIIIFLDYMGI